MAYNSSHTGAEIDAMFGFQQVTPTAGTNVTVNTLYAYVIGRVLYLNGYITTTAAISAGATLFSIPGYRVLTLTQIPSLRNTSTTIDAAPYKFRAQNTGGQAPIAVQTIGALSSPGNYSINAALVLALN